MEASSQKQANTDGKIFLTADWRHLLLVNYEVNPDILAPHVPRGVELDLFGGKCFVSLVGFMFLRTRLLGKLPIPFHTNFEEINLRFYVKRKEGEETRRGVCFLKEIVPRYAIALVARKAYGERYVSHPMSHILDIKNSALAVNGRVVYSWLDEKRHSIGAKCTGNPSYPAAGSQEHFIIEHYFGYVKSPAGQTVEYRVEHPEWRVLSCKEPRVDVDVARTYGPEFVEPLSKTPASVFVAEGSPVTVRQGRILPEAAG
ncbi:MAG TPA: DUF2071 domain-containing protein [Leptospiraceae bacterium]|nr:DUF2071 domain-containing protein [Leptospirales bacterium]HMX58036.1 DUF2071 domain-containing protein [Leptospiraceae bacterium]HMY45195.1 DUF2071 domain-containing protein [Leptospiraceae bacterium]HMZ37913.1 DUF2071 domain-containing protein [Leptospiraceae bacterium]HNE25028.1 DUF2071 domain-containing protein [Leptospiraceae bacterium]